MFRDLWLYRRGVVIVVAVLAVFVVAGLVVALVFGPGRVGAPDPSDAPPAAGPTAAAGEVSTSGSDATGPSRAAGSSGAGEYAGQEQGGFAAGAEVPPIDGSGGYPAGQWDMLPAAPEASVSPSYPALTDAARSQQDLFAREFFTTLFTRDYAASSRGELLAWAQAMGAPMTIEQVPLSEDARLKVLSQSLTMANFDSEQTASVVPDAVAWAQLAAAGASTSVSDVRVEAVPASQFPPPNTTFTLPTFDRLVTGTVTTHTQAGDVATSVALEILMSLDKGQLGAAQVQHFIAAQIGG